MGWRPEIAARLGALAALLFQTAVLSTADPVYVRESAGAIAIGNGFLERTVSTAEGSIGTTGFLNKLSGRRYNVSGTEFEARIVYERVGYDFGDENPMVVTAAGLRISTHRVENFADGGKRLVVRLVPGANWKRHWIGVDLFYELHPQDPFIRQWVRIARPEQGSYFVDWIAPARNTWDGAAFTLGGFGQPLYAADLFLGLEYPTALNTASGSEATLGGYVGLPVPAEGYTSEPAVIGVAADGKVRDQFLAYIDRMRAAPVRPFLLYNSWYDLQRLAMNRENTLERVPLLDRTLLQKYGLHLDSFVLDDGWDNMRRLWTIDEHRFPGGFTDLARALSGIGSRLGLWFGPIGGYDQRPVRVASGRAQGLEVTANGQYLCSAGQNYSRLLSDTMAAYQKQYGVNYFKIDGIAFGCNDASHGHPTGIYSREATTRALIALLQRLRQQDPKVFLNITTSVWLSPWWLRWADTVWMGGEDSGYLASVPALAPRQSAISYRDSVLYQDFVAHRAQFPMSSLMTHGIIKGKYNLLGGAAESLEDWTDEVVHYFLAGNMMYELYISPDLLSAEEMDVLGKVAKWAVANAHPLLDNTTMVLGDPARREPYGFVHWGAEKSIVMLRNPFARPQTVNLEITEQNGFHPFSEPHVVELLSPHRQTSFGGVVRFGDPVTFLLNGYEQIVFELRPLAYDERSKSFTDRDYSSLLVPPTITKDTAAGTISTSFTIPLRPNAGGGRLAILIEPQPGTAEVVDNGHPLNLTAETGGGKAWQWFWADLPAGRHDLAVKVHAPGTAHISAWLLAHGSPDDSTAKPDSAIPQHAPKVTYSLFKTSLP